MIPYFPQPELHLGSLTFHAFGALVGLGVVAGLAFVYRRAAEMKIDLKDMRGAAWSALILGFWWAFALEIVFYKPELLRQEGPLVLFSVSHGMSSYGGFLGAFVGLLVYYGIRRRPWIRQADVLVQGIVIGWVFGRLGCTLAHDHQGRRTDFFLAFDYPGGARHNLGFYELAYTLLVLVPAILLVHGRFRSPSGAHATVVALLYAPLRFGLDFLRSTDQHDSDLRYYGLTFAQYCCLALFAFGVVTAPRTLRGLRAARAAAVRA
jgi:phosphatidylglycerol---prolipoprotein diacylglyceryl transferase